MKIHIPQTFAPLKVLVLLRHLSLHGSFSTRPPHSPILLREREGATCDSECETSGATLTIFAGQPHHHTPVTDPLQTPGPAGRVSGREEHSLPSHLGAHA